MKFEEFPNNAAVSCKMEKMWFFVLPAESTLSDISRDCYYFTGATTIHLTPDDLDKHYEVEQGDRKRNYYESKHYCASLNADRGSKLGQFSTALDRNKLLLVLSRYSSKSYIITA